jgi:beta-aspartyl-dipeptidase (metallo-type)
MLLIIKNAQIFAPEEMGTKDVLIGGKQILAIEDAIEGLDGYAQTVDAKGKIMVPGFVDSLVHVLGGGGEGGFTTRTPEVQLSHVIEAGVTTLVGALGTDSIGRNLAGLIGKVKELKAHGLNAYFYTGSYHLPIDTLTGSVQKDLIMLEECLGVGEVAIADHRGSQPQVHELARVAADARVGGMLSGKAGIVSIHVGDAKDRLDVLHQVSEKTAIPLSVFYPTHINRNLSLLSAGKKFAQAGGTIDLTTSSNPQSFELGEIKCSRALKYLLEAGVNEAQITFSSDGHASLPEFDEKGDLTSLETGKISSLYTEVKDAVLTEGIPLESALKTITSNPANLLKLSRKGRIAVGLDADLVLLNENTMDIDTVVCGGEFMLKAGRLEKKGLFE